MGITIADVGDGVAASQGFIQILNQLSGGIESRSVILQIDNRTKMTLGFWQHTDAHGGIHETPPGRIPPGHSGVFSAQSTGFLTGVEGTASYVGAGFSFTVHWNVPFLGLNTLGASIDGELGARYSKFAINGVGNQKVHMRFDINADVLDYASIQEKADALSEAGLSLGSPTGPEAFTPDNVGKGREYEHGVIYWSPITTAHEVHGLILAKWAQLGRERYGYPVSDEMLAPDGGRVSHFQRMIDQQIFRGSIYWSSRTGANEVQGLIRDEWWSRGGPGGVLGYPIADEENWLGGPGRLSRFEHGSISWKSDTGQITVIGP
ncbi:LGFP repeat-containing protein [Nonomuraea endophytica]|uniref:LGFP repeat-containing protein n=1 Tax=Nonomuraea endophytica TaxID=714136 RepID=UPI0037C7996A